VPPRASATAGARKASNAPMSSTVSSPSAQLRTAPPPRAERVAAVRALMGEPDPAVRHLAAGIRATARRHFALHVDPLIDAAWPALRGTAFEEKLRIGACDLYASAPYTALFCAPRRPPLVRLVTVAGDRLPLPLPALALLGRGAMTLLGRFAYPAQHRSIALVSAFIVVVDHALDHCMDDPPALRGPRLEAVIAGRAPADVPALALTRALAVAMAQGLDPADQEAFARAMERVTGWIRAEVRAMRGEPDPAGLGHRLAGVEGTIDGLLFPVARYAGEGARAWMYDVSLFVQVMDDWFDYDADLCSERATPVTTGRWTLDDVESTWRRTTEGIESLVRASGLRSPRYVRFVREAYVLMMHEVMEAMAERPDA
jgi:hypothetical protein